MLLLLLLLDVSPSLSTTIWYQPKCDDALQLWMWLLHCPCVTDWVTYIPKHPPRIFSHDNSLPPIAKHLTIPPLLDNSRRHFCCPSLCVCQLNVRADGLLVLRCRQTVDVEDARRRKLYVHTTTDVRRRQADQRRRLVRTVSSSLHTVLWWVFCLKLCRSFSLTELKVHWLWASYSHLSASVTNEYNLVLA